MVLEYLVHFRSYSGFLHWARMTLPHTVGQCRYNCVPLVRGSAAVGYMTLLAIFMAADMPISVMIPPVHFITLFPPTPIRLCLNNKLNQGSDIRHMRMQRSIRMGSMRFLDVCIRCIRFAFFPKVVHAAQTSGVRSSVKGWVQACRAESSSKHRKLASYC